MVAALKKKFPLLEHYPELIYFDNAATTQKPQSVIDAIQRFYAYENAPIGRSAYPLAERATEQYEEARKKIAAFLGAQANEIIFTSGATEGINVVAQAWGAQHLQAGDEILMTELEHHSMLVVWQLLAQNVGAQIRYIPVTDQGELDLSRLDALVTERTKLVAITHISNAIGTVVPVARIIAAARAVGARILLDGAQAVGHQPIDLAALQVDFWVCSAHKMLGPTGLGLLYIREAVQAEVEPYRYGGGMVYQADYQQATFLARPYCFQAGSPPAAQVAGLAAAVDFFTQEVDFALLRVHQQELMRRTLEGLAAMKRVTCYGPRQQLIEEGHLASFAVQGVHAHDVAAALGEAQICVRAGHFCAQPLAKRLQIQAAVRVSFHLYNSIEQVERFLECIENMGVYFYL